MNQKPTLGFIGAGKVGHTLARLWYERGYVVTAVYSRTADHAQTLAVKLSAKVVDSPGAVVDRADLTLLTVPDDAIPSVVAAIASERRGDAGGKAIIHTSGARDSLILAPLSEQGFMTGSLHPVFPFADVETAADSLPGATFGLEVEANVLRDWLQAMVEALDGRIIHISPGQKAVYHSAFVFASNYAVTLYAVAERLLAGIGAERAVVDNALNTLLAGTVENLRTQGVPGALTGPLVRGDVGTLEAHQMALAAIDEDLRTLYKQLARSSLPMLDARHIDITFIEEFLNRDNHASDHP